MNGKGGASTNQLTFGSAYEKSKKDQAVTTKKLRALLEKQKYKCALTGDDLTPKTASLDHIIPLSRGGQHSIDNAQVILDYVNRAKGQMTAIEFITMCRKVASLHGDE